MTKSTLSLLVLVPALLLFLAVFGDFPYSFFQLLRVAVFVFAVFIAVQAHKAEKESMAWLFGAVAFLFNPLFPIHLSRSIWQVIDFGAAIAFLVAPKGITSNNPE